MWQNIIFLSSFPRRKQIVSKCGCFPVLLQNLKVGFLYVYRMVFRDFNICNRSGKSYVTGVLEYSEQYGGIVWYGMVWYVM